MTEYWVDNNVGDNTDPGSQAEPWETINYAQAQLGLGDILNIVNTGIDWTGANNGFTINDATDYSANPIVIQGEDPADPPTMALNTNWRWTNGQGWTVKDLIFDGYTGGTIFKWGQGGNCYDMTLEDCVFKHSVEDSVALINIDGFTISGCLFRDVRSRVAGTDTHAIYAWVDSECKNGTISLCVFEDIGADGIQFGDRADTTNTVVEDCSFFVNRPYSAVGTSLYDRVTVTTWQDFSTNVGENGIDIKTNVDGVTIRRCCFYGFYTTVGGQDVDGGSDGEGILIHKDSKDVVVVEDCILYDCDRSIEMQAGAGTYTGGIFRRLFIHSCDEGMRARAAGMAPLSEGWTLEDSVFSNCTDTLDMGASKVKSIQGNMFVNGTATRNSGSAGADNIDYNLWSNVVTQNCFQLCNYRLRARSGGGVGVRL